MSYATHAISTELELDNLHVSLRAFVHELQQGRNNKRMCFRNQTHHHLALLGTNVAQLAGRARWKRHSENARSYKSKIRKVAPSKAHAAKLQYDGIHKHLFIFLKVEMGASRTASVC